MNLPVSAPTAAAIFFTTWWICLFAVLPFGVKSQHEAPERLAGTDPGAPVAHLMVKKAIVTTIIAAIVFSGLMAYIAWVG
jgi:predicted secreted protein